MFCTFAGITSLTLNSKLCNFITSWNLIKMSQIFARGPFPIKLTKICHENEVTFVTIVRCAIWYKTLKNGIRMVSQNTIPTSQNALERLSQKSIYLNPFAWHSISYMTFNHSHGMYMTLEWHANRKSWKHSNCSIRKLLQKLLHKLLH